MLVIRLSRTGKSAQPSYRVIVSEKSKDPWGKYLEILGHYYPKKEAKLVDLKEERLKYWIGKGAQLSETVNNLLVNQGVVNAPKVRMVKISKRRAAKIAEKNKKEEAPKETAKVEEKIEVPAEEKKTEEPKVENPVEAPKAETPVEKVEEPKAEVPAEEVKNEVPVEEIK
ncbi:MAG: 30S ribosomal protein S16, partial [Patescibacteria group bacterium]